MWITATEVIEFTGVKPQTFRYEKTDDAKLQTLIDKWITQSESLICTYCNNKFQDTVPDAVKNVCLRLTANMVALAQARKETPVVKVNDWTIQTVGSDIFTDDLKEDLAPFKYEMESHKSDNVEFLAITGEDVW